MPSEHHAVSPRLLRIYERSLRITLERKWVLGLFATVLIAGQLLLLHRHRHRPAARHGRRRLHCGLHHAGRRVARKKPIASSPTSRRFCWPRRKWKTFRGAPEWSSDLAQVTEAEYRRHFGEVEAPSASAARMTSSPTFAPRSRRPSRSATSSGAASPGHDRRFDQRAASRW